jgi:hypothetical protein
MKLLIRDGVLVCIGKVVDEGYGGGGGVDVVIQIFLTPTLVRLSGQLHAPASLPPKKEPSIHFG